MKIIKEELDYLTAWNNNHRGVGPGSHLTSALFNRNNLQGSTNTHIKRREKRREKTLFLNMHVLRSVSLKNSTDTIETDYSFDVLKSPISLQTCLLSRTAAPAWVY